MTNLYTGSSHEVYNANFRLTKKMLFIFLNLRGFEDHLIMQEIDNFGLKINVLPNGMEKYGFYVSYKIGPH